MSHYCDEIMFFSWVPFIEMHMVINAFLDLVNKTWIKTNNFIMKIIVRLFIDKKIHLLKIMNY